MTGVQTQADGGKTPEMTGVPRSALRRQQQQQAQQQQQHVTGGADLLILSMEHRRLLAQMERVLAEQPGLAAGALAESEAATTTSDEGANSRDAGQPRKNNNQTNK